jgi:type VI secretion system protein VasI
MFGATDEATLYILCMENRTSLFVVTNCHLASGFQGYGDVEYRIDDKPAKTRAFDASTDNTSLGLWSGGASIPVIKELIEGSALLVRFTPFNHSPVTARFSITGLDEAIKPLRTARGW